VITMTLSEASHTLRIQQENHRRNVRLRLNGKPAPKSWEQFVERRIRELKTFIKDEQFRDTSCTGKQRYPSMAAALADLHRLQASKTGFKHGSRISAYLCKFCQQAHIGSQSTPRRTQGEAA